MRVATHSGSFHADEVFAVAALMLLGTVQQVARSRDREVLAAADVRVDVGFRDDPDGGDFDHHQRGFDRVRENGVRLASFGLVWARYGAELCAGEPAVAAVVDATLVQGIDAADSGQQLSESIIEDIHPMTVSGIIGGFNARWDEAFTPEEERARFDAAVGLARDILTREIASAASARRAVGIVQAAVTAAPDPRLVELPVNAPWKRALVPATPAAQFVILPKRNGYGLEAVPRELGSFVNRKDLPASWAGLDGEDLVAVTGVPDAVFCHVKRFVAVARSHAGIRRLAELALAD
jgi:uncharacterized UPF0160 family protein